MQMLMALNGVLEVRKRSIKCQFDELLDTGTVLMDRIVHLVDWFSESVNSMELVCYMSRRRLALDSCLVFHLPNEGGFSVLTFYPC